MHLLRVSSRGVIPTLVRMFYHNLGYVWGIITSEVRKRQIKLTLQEFMEIYDLPCSKPRTKCSKYSHILTATSFLLDPNYGIPTPFNVRSVFPNIHITHYVISHILTPKKHNFGQLSRVEVVAVYKFVNILDTNWDSALIAHMIDNKLRICGYHMVGAN